jgi:hypothetical protein
VAERESERARERERERERKRERERERDRESLSGTILRTAEQIKTSTKPPVAALSGQKELMCLVLVNVSLV